MADKASRRILEGPLALEVARFGVPIAIGMALQTTFNLADAYLVAQIQDPAEAKSALGALGICDQLAAICTIVSYGVSTAAGTLLSQRKGAGNTEGVQRAAWQSLIVVAGLSLLFAILGGVFADVIVRDIVGAKGDVARDAVPYLRVIVGGSFSILFLLQLTSMQRALGSAKTPTALMVFGNVINIFLAILLIFGPGPAPPAFAWLTGTARALGIPRMGMMGAAWATIIARSLVLVPIAIILVKRFKIVFPAKGHRGADAKELKTLIHLAWPTSTQFVIRIAAMLLVNSLVARFFTTEADQTATTAIGLVFRLDSMALFVAMGWGSAAQTFVGQNLGAGHKLRAVESGWYTALYDAITNVGLVLMIWFYGQEILHVFNDDPKPVGIAIEYLRTVAPSYVALGIGVALGNAMAAAGATKTTLGVDVLVIVAFQFPLCIVAVAVFGVERAALFRCVMATNVVSAVAYAIVYTRKKWLAAHHA